MDEFAEVLRAWRDRVRPEEAGLAPGADRRVPGLRREELAALAGVSVEYVVRLEQGRARNPSPQLLAALARALRLTDAERDHLFRVGGAAVPARSVVPSAIAPSVQRLVDRLGDVAVAVHTAAWDLVQWNPLWAALTCDPSRLRGIERNVAWRHFTGAPTGVDFDDEHRDQFSDDLAADLRSAVGRYPTDPGLATLVRRLRAESADFERRWKQARIAHHSSSTKIATSTPVGPVRVDCDVLTVPDGDLRIVVLSARPGSDDADKLRLLAVVGLQELTVP